MNPDLSLSLVGMFAGFVLRTTLAYSVCVILSRLLKDSSHRFILWAGFLYGSAAYWLYLATTVFPVRHAAQSSLLAVSSHQTETVWTIPDAWAFSLGIVLGVAAVFYAVTLIYNVVTHAMKLRRLHWVMSFATEPPAGIAEIGESLAKSLGIRAPRLLMLSGASSPATFGWLRPVILLPTVCVEQNSADLESILLHELHHVRRRDSFWNALAMAARAVVCFHPAAWHAMRALQFHRELACDSAVVSRAPARKGLYAESLLRFARLNLAQEPASWGIDFAASPEHLSVRIHSILAEASKTSPWFVGLRSAFGLALLAVFAAVMPSLGILLGYTHPAPALAVSTLVSPAANVRKTQRVARHAHAVTLSSTEAEDVSLPVDEPAKDVPVETEMASATKAQAPPDLMSGPGPHLQRRPSSAAGTKAQAIPLIDQGDSGQKGKHGDKVQTLGQSAVTAAAIWKRVSDVDRH